ncbi:hypothetical protein [Kitasatospora sp. GP82]|uniref:hypothetical protein n=1 Tax=Kitasatospora sp. GP82 TaxID=3035089 RepID=UPI0024747F47|nr:hypothetical protein [Kitasatospora sp. GP82]MDH6125229.1 hypothetical protein [Kitasatospora sp. GP82]
MTKVQAGGVPANVALLPVPTGDGPAGAGSAGGRFRRPMAGYVFAASASVVAIWTVMVGFYAEPDRRVLWVGFNTLLTATMVLAARLALRADSRVALAAAGLAVFMVADAWFDITTAPSDYLPMSLLTAVFLEAPFAVGCMLYALRVHRRATG